MDIGNKLEAIVFASKKYDSLFPFDLYWQAACLPVANQNNIVAIVSSLKGLGFKTVHVVIGYRQEQVKALLSGFDEVVYHQGDRLPPELLAKPLLVIDGAVYSDPSLLSGLVEKHLESGSSVLSVRPKDEYNRSIDGFGIKLADDRVAKMFGHARDHYIDYLANGIYLLDPKVLSLQDSTDLGLEYVPSGGMPPLTFYVEAMIQKALELGEPFEYVVDPSAINLRFPWNLFLANQKAAQKICGAIKEDDLGEGTTVAENILKYAPIKTGKNCLIRDNVIIRGPVVLGDNVTIESGAILEGDNIIGSNSFVKDYAKLVKGTVLGNRCRVGFNAELGGLYFDDVSAIHSLEIYGIMGKSVDIAAGCTVGFMRFDDSEHLPRVNGKTFRGKYANAVCVGDYTRMGIMNFFHPGVRVGANCSLGPGAIIENDVPHGTLVRVKQEQEYRSWSTDRYGWQ